VAFLYKKPFIKWIITNELTARFDTSLFLLCSATAAAAAAWSRMPKKESHVLHVMTHAAALNAGKGQLPY
jgi:hypothetical protein